MYGEEKEVSRKRNKAWRGFTTSASAYPISAPHPSSFPEAIPRLCGGSKATIFENPGLPTGHSQPGRRHLSTQGAGESAQG